LQPAKIAEALLWLLRNGERAEDMRKRGQKAVLERYSWEQEAKHLISAYDAL
jgi:glycosyltransferase involved in cell wall biosynthesis